MKWKEVMCEKWLGSFHVCNQEGANDGDAYQEILVLWKLSEG